MNYDEQYAKYSKKLRQMCPCMHDGCQGITGFVREHPFKPGWDIRRCFDCGRDSAQSDALLNAQVMEKVRVGDLV